MSSSVAENKIEAFRRLFGEKTFYFACHAAFPLILTPELAYQIWAYFQKDINNNWLNIPWIGVSDLLLSSLCQKVGFELYEMNNEIRNNLLETLESSKIFGPNRIKELASFLLGYINNKNFLNSEDYTNKNIGKVQQWTSFAYLNPDKFAEELCNNLSPQIEKEFEFLRISSIAESLSKPLIKAGYQPLLYYTKGISEGILGNEKNKTDYLSKITSPEIKVGTLKFKFSIINERLEKIEAINYSNQALTEFPTEIFELRNVGYLNLSGNELKNIPKEISKLINLKELNLQNNKLEELPSEIGHIHNLKRLVLSNNKLKKLPEEIKNLNKIEEIYLDRNFLEEFTEITSLKNLKILSLFDNKITQLHPNIGSLINLEILNLSNNNLEVVPFTICSLHNLTQLYLDRNNISEFPNIEENSIFKLTNLSLSVNKLNKIPLGVKYLTQLKRLSLYNNNIKEISKEIVNLLNLEELKLSNNLIEELPIELIQLTKLKVLDLTGNSIKNIPNNVLEKLSPQEIFNYINPLINLDYSNKGLTEIPKEVFDLKNAETLNLSGNNLTEIPKEISKLFNLKKLNLSKNKFNELPVEIGQLINLQELNLSENSLTELPKEITKLVNLGEINLNKNQISELPEGVENLISLRKIFLFDNHLKKVPEGINKITNLQVLYLNLNQLTELTEEITNLINLEELDLSSNSLKNFPKEILNLKNLKILILSHNQLTEIPEEITQLNKLEKLRLSANKLNKFPKEITQLENLVSIDFSGNKLNEIPEEIDKLTKLEEFLLSGNEILKLPKNIINIQSLKDIYLSNNKLPKIPEQIFHLKNLRIADLSKNLLSKIPEEITNLENLQILYLSNNQLTEIPFWIKKLERLERLVLYNNKITKLPKELFELKNLKYLYLFGIQITEIPKEISQLIKLEELYLSSNQITTLPPEIGELINLTKLDLHNNKITQLPSEIIKLTKLTQLDLSKNPLEKPPLEVCNQGIEAIRQYFINSPKNGTYFDLINDEFKRKFDIDLRITNDYRFIFLKNFALKLFLESKTNINIYSLATELKLDNFFKNMSEYEIIKFLKEFFELRFFNEAFEFLDKLLFHYLVSLSFVEQINNNQDKDFGKLPLEPSIVGFIAEQKPNTENLFKFLKEKYKGEKEKFWKGGNAASILVKMNKEILKGEDLSKLTLNNALLNDAILDGADFSHSDLRDVKFTNSSLNSCNFIESNLLSSDFSYSICNNSSFSKSSCHGVNFNKASLRDTDFFNLHAENSDFYGTNLENSDFYGATLIQSSFEGSRLINVIFRKTRLPGVNFSKTNLEETILLESTYDKDTIFPTDFKPEKYGMTLMEKSTNENRPYWKYPVPVNIDPIAYINNSKMYFNRGKYYFDQKNFSVALENLEEAIKLNSSLVEAYSYLIDIYTENGNIKKAQNYIKQSKDILQKNTLLNLILQEGKKYEKIRNNYSSSSKRTTEMLDVIDFIESKANESEFSEKEIKYIFSEGSEGNRIVAIGILKSKPYPECFEIVKNVINNSRSAFELFHCLIATDKMLNNLSFEQKNELKIVLENLFNFWKNKANFRPDSNCFSLRNKIYNKIENELKNSLEIIFTLPENFKREYDNILDEEDVPFGRIQRKRYSIALPKGLSKTEIEENIKDSLNTYLKDKSNICAVMVFVYRDTDIERSAYTVARGTFAPFGDWSRANEFKSYRDNKLVVKFSEPDKNKPLNELLQKTIIELEKITQTSYNQIFLISRYNNEELIAVAQIGNGQYRKPAFSGIIGTCYKTKKTINEDDVSKSVNYIPASLSTKSELAVPISYRKSVYGVFNSESSNRNYFTYEIQSQVEELANTFSGNLLKYWTPELSEKELPWIKVKSSFKEKEAMPITKIVDPYSTIKLKQDFKKMLVELILKIPGINAPAARAALLVGLPAHLLVVGGAAKTDIILIVEELDKIGELDSGEEALIVFAENALPFFQGFRAGNDLRELIDNYKNFRPGVLTKNNNASKNTGEKNSEPTKKGSKTPKNLVQKSKSNKKVVKTPLMNILHLSDLHFGRDKDASLWYSQLSLDLTSELECKKIDIVILSGDITNHSTPEQYNSASIFLENLSNEFNLKKEQFVIVPGNHDLNWDLSKKSYALHESATAPLEGTFIPTKEDNVFRLRNDEKYKLRFQYFSDFYKSFIGEEYSLEYDQQFKIHHFPQQKLLILGLNSAWNIDHHYKSRVSINMEALTNGLSEIKKNKAYSEYMKIAVFHHPLNSSGEDKITDHGFLELLAVAGFRFILHGHVHRATDSNYKYDHSAKGRNLEIISAGTFGSPTLELVPAYPWQYNFIDVFDDKIKVNTRKREELNGAFKPDARWLQGKGKNPLPYYEISI